MVLRQTLIKLKINLKRGRKDRIPGPELEGDWVEYYLALYFKVTTDDKTRLTYLKLLPDQGLSRKRASESLAPQMRGSWARQTAHQLRALAAPAEDPGAVPSTHVRRLTAACDSGSRGSKALFWPLGTCMYAACTQREAHTYT